MSFPTISAAHQLARELAHRFDADRQGGEISGLRGAHLGNSALPVREFLPARIDPGGDPGRSTAATRVLEHPLGETPVHAQRRIAQPGARHRLPRALDGELLDARLQPVAADARPDLDVHARSLDDADAVPRGDLDDVE